MGILNIPLTTGTIAVGLTNGNNVSNAEFTADVAGFLTFGVNRDWTASQVSLATDTITQPTAHLLSPGQKVTVQTSGSLPGGLVINTPYWIYVTTPFTFGFCSSYTNFLAGTLVDLNTGPGTGTSTVIVSPFVPYTANYGIPFYANSPIFLNAAEYPDIQKQWNISAASNGNIAIFYTLPTLIT